MARSTGVSQPHLHNILKGIRSLPPDLADQLLVLAGLSLPNLMGMRQFPDESAAGAHPAKASHGNSPLMEIFLPKSGDSASNFPAYQLPPDSVMEPRFRGGDIVYYHHGARDRSSLNAQSAYLVNYHDRVLVRYLRMGGQRLYLASEETLHDPVRWDYVSLADRHILEIVRGRIVWICRKVEQDQAGAFEETRGDDRRVG